MRCKFSSTTNEIICRNHVYILEIQRVRRKGYVDTQSEMDSSTGSGGEEREGGGGVAGTARDGTFTGSGSAVHPRAECQFDCCNLLNGEGLT
jgi:hypothetical protein